MIQRWPSLTRSEAVVVFGCACALVLIAADVRAGGLFTQFDQSVRARLQSRTGPPSGWLDIPAGMGDLWIAAACLIATSLVAAQMCWQAWPFLVAGVNFAAAELLILVLKLVVGRSGPGEYADRTGYPGYFPSGHTTTSAVCAATMVWLILAARGPLPGPRARAAVTAFGLLVGALSGWAALLLDTHWLTDVLGGLLLACVVVVVGLELSTAWVRGRVGLRAGGGAP